MSLPAWRRRFRQAVGSHDWLEGVTTFLGVCFLLLAGVCAWAIVVSVTSLGDPDPAFEAAPGFLQAARGTGVVLFGVFGVVAAGVGWFLAGDAIRRVGGRLRGRS
jgi:hypothetical protein